MGTTKEIKVFVTYAWGNKEHEEKVERFVATLREHSYTAVIDKMLLQMESSMDFMDMMYENIQSSNKVIIVLSKDYKTKAEEGSGGVGIEYKLIRKLIGSQKNKFILVTFDGYSEEIIPLAYENRFFHDLQKPDSWEELFAKLNDEIIDEYPEISDNRPIISKRKISPLVIPRGTPIDVAKVTDLNDDRPIVWDKQSAEQQLRASINNGDLTEIKEVLQANSFLFYDVYHRKASAMPIFHEVPIGKSVVDFLWLDDSSSGPEWVLIKISIPHLKIIGDDGIVSAQLLKELEKIKYWISYLNENPGMVKGTFGAATNFNAVLIIGSPEDWNNEEAAKWRANHNRESSVQIRSYNTFNRSLLEFKEAPVAFYRFNHFPITSPNEDLEKFWKNYRYMDFWRKL